MVVSDMESLIIAALARSGHTAESLAATLSTGAPSCALVKVVASKLADMERRGHVACVTRGDMSWHIAKRV